MIGNDLTKATVSFRDHGSIQYHAQRVKINASSAKLLFRIRHGFIERATEGTRTPDLTITNRLLYQLSYSGKSPCVGAFKARIIQISRFIASDKFTKSGFQLAVAIL
jgi:hypothetical protein